MSSRRRFGMLMRQNVASMTCRGFSDVIDWSAILIDLWRHLDGSCPSWVKNETDSCTAVTRAPLFDHLVATGEH